MSEKEFYYRKDLGDGFIKSILDNEHIVLVNKIETKKNSVDKLN